MFPIKKKKKVKGKKVAPKKKFPMNIGQKVMAQNSQYFGK